jgi:hypothetical protein
MPYVAPTSLVAAKRRPLPAVPSDPAAAAATTTSLDVSTTDHHRGGPGPARGPKGRRIPAPSILPPVLDQTHSHSKLHLSLNSGFSSLQKQVEELQARHNQASSSRHSTRSQGVPPPPLLPPKRAVDIDMAQHQQQQRRPLPVPPKEQPQRPAQHQYPASYGPSISKIRSFSAQPPSSSVHAGLPPGAAGFPRPYDNAFPASPFPLASTAAGPAFPYHQHPGVGNSQAYVPQNGTVSRSFAKGGASIMLHKGFFDLLSLVPYDPTPPNPNYLQQQAGSSSRNGTDQAGWMGDKPTRSIMRAVTTPIFASQSVATSSNQPPQNGNVARLQTRGNRRISVDMVGKPTGFT